VVPIKGLEENDLVSRIEQRQARSIEPASSACGHQNFRIRIRPNAVVRSQLTSDGVTQCRDAVEAGVRVQALFDCLDSTLRYERRKFGIADSLREIDPTDALALDGHRPNLGLNDQGGNLAQVALSDSCWHELAFSESQVVGEETVSRSSNTNLTITKCMSRFRTVILG
jgi:hypothetical protein